MGFWTNFYLMSQKDEGNSKVEVACYSNNTYEFYIGSDISLFGSLHSIELISYGSIACMHKEGFAAIAQNIRIFYAGCPM